MNKIKNNESGFSAVEGLLVLIIVALIGFIGWYVWHVQSTKKTTTVTITTPKTNTVAPTPVADPYSGWKTYCDSDINACFKYPADWKLNTSLPDIKAFVQNTSEAVNIKYAQGSAEDAGLGEFYTHSLVSLDSSNNYKIVGGYQKVSNIPYYYVINQAKVAGYGLAESTTTTLNDKHSLSFTKQGNTTEYVLSANRNTSESQISTSVADAWFDSADGKTALLILKSFYFQ